MSAISPPDDILRCDHCGEPEHIDLLDGVITADGQDAGTLACIACYPSAIAKAQPDLPEAKRAQWCPLAREHFDLSVNRRLQPLYAKWEA